MVLKAIYESKDEIPEQHQDLFTERNGKWELTGVTGIKTTADVERVQNSLTAERNAHKETKEKLKSFEGLDAEDVRSKLDRIEELEAAAKDKLDDDKIDEMVERRIRSKLAPLEREKKKLEERLGELNEQNESLVGEKRTRTIHDHVRKALTEAKVIPDAYDDALLHADRIFEIQEDGAVVTKDGVGLTPGLAPDAWLQEIQEKRRHWWPESVGGGSQGSGKGGIGVGGKNPFSAEHWNLTEQSKVFKEHGREKAEQLAKAAGTTVGGGRPPAKKG